MAEIADSVPELPIIETERLRLRGHRSEDLPDCFAMWSDPEVVRFIGGNPSSELQTWSRVLAYVGHWKLMGFGYWAIEEKESGAFVGEAGFADFKRDIEASMKGYPEIGFALIPRVHGKGYATEAVRAVVAWGDKNLHARQTVCLINEENAASVRVAEKVGYELFKRGEYNGLPTLFLRRPKH